MKSEPPQRFDRRGRGIDKQSVKIFFEPIPAQESADPDRRQQDSGHGSLNANDEPKPRILLPIEIARDPERNQSRALNE
jgi:hypothetical protein